MILLSQLNIFRDSGATAIQLLHGDLTEIPTEHAADILIISAYPNDYSVADKKTLMAALYYKGIIVDDLAKDKEVDLTGHLNCWLSKPLTARQQQQFNFKRILCFEPPAGEGKEKVVSNIFRCINAIAFDKQNNVIAMPVLASGNQKVPLEKMLPAIMDAAIFWLENGLPLDCIKLVLRNEEQVAAALPIFLNAKQQYELKVSAQQGAMSAAEAWKMFELKNKTQSPGTAVMPIVESEIRDLAARAIIPQPPAHEPGTQVPPAPQPSGATSVESALLPDDRARSYDFFISYSHKQSTEVKHFVDALLMKNPHLKIFYDRTSIPPGGLWIKLISDAIQNSHAVICILSPQYSTSDVCWDEFQCAKTKEYRSKKSVIRTINLYNDVNLPLMMSIYSYIDCTEGDLQKLKDCVQQLI